MRAERTLVLPGTERGDVELDRGMAHAAQQDRSYDCETMTSADEDQDVEVKDGSLAQAGPERVVVLVEPLSSQWSHSM